MIEDLWRLKGFKPNPQQEEIILFDQKKPLFIMAAPGSGKTRVLLWRTVNLIVNKNVPPEKIFLSTFTEKAAHQLVEGLKELLGLASNITNQKYDLARMYVGTIHSNCRRLLADRSFSSASQRQVMPKIMDGLGQYLFIYNSRHWTEILAAAGLENNLETNQIFNSYLGTPQTRNSQSRHKAVINTISFFNRMSEELVDPDTVKVKDKTLKILFRMYSFYLKSLKNRPVPHTDLSLLQAEALRKVTDSSKGGQHFDHVIIDEYQDTNTVQERLVFKLASATKNLCVVGDDDQALYRFRGATVENFVDFPARCKKYFGIAPVKIPLQTNYRSLKPIVDISQSFIQETDWKIKNQIFRIPKEVKADRSEKGPAVFVTDEGKPEDVAKQTAKFISELKKKKIVNDYNEIAVLFSYLKGNKKVETLTQALETKGIKVYAPRAGCFLDLEESLATFGLFAQIIGRPPFQGHGQDMDDFRGWMDRCVDMAETMLDKDPALKAFISSRKKEIEKTVEDYQRLVDYCAKSSLDLKDSITLKHLMEMAKISGLSKGLSQKLSQRSLLKLVQYNPSKATASYVINRVTSLDWGLMDLYYHLTTFNYFREIIEAAASGEDEGPMCNLGLITQYISRFQEERGRPILTAWDFSENHLNRHLFASYLFAMYRLSESEYEDKEDPFPKGRVSFITIHQAKGLEFPVVILGGLYRQDRGPGPIEEIVRNELNQEGEPLDRMSSFDNARLFYVALTRAKNVLVLPRYKGQGQRTSPEFKQVLTNDLPNLDSFDWARAEKARESSANELGRPYSYTSDYIFYKRCPRQYMLFKKYGWVPTRSAVMFFGTLVHRTIEDLHNHLLAQKA